MHTSDFDYSLPPELIAQAPLPERDRARMLVLRRAGGAIEHRRVLDLPEFLRPGDLMVVNDTRVIPARLFGRKAAAGGGRVEVLLVEPLDVPDRWRALCRVSGRIRAGDRYLLASGKLDARVTAPASGGGVDLQLTVTPAADASGAAEPAAAGAEDALMAILEAEGVPPLPPYIRRPPPAANPGATGQIDVDDRQRYQTVYAARPGAVAAPTAGLHFSRELLDAIARRGIRRAALTLHVGPGTFKPVKTEDIEAHAIESERFELPAATAAAIAETRRDGGRVLAVGSTVVRTLEHVAALHGGRIAAAGGRAGLFIKPGFRFRAVDLMLTNFHLPRSTLLMMVAALAGRENVLRAYREAVDRRYRFYSYGDCMLIV